MALRAALDGIGIAYVPEDLAAPFPRAGQPVRVLEQWPAATEGLFPFYHGHRQVPTALRAFIDMVPRQGRRDVRSRVPYELSSKPRPIGDEVNLLEQDCAYSPPCKDPYYANRGVDAVRQKRRLQRFDSAAARVGRGGAPSNPLRRPDDVVGPAIESREEVVDPARLQVGELVGAGEIDAGGEKGCRHVGGVEGFLQCFERPFRLAALGGKIGAARE